MKTCENCNTEHDGSYATGRFCSITCSKGFSTKAKRAEINKKVADKLKGHTSTLKGVTGRYSEETIEKMSARLKKRWDSISDNERAELSIKLKNRKGTTKFKECKVCKNAKHILYSSKICEDCKEPLRLYKEKCKFTFNVYNFPCKFDLSLIKMFGWYSPTNSKEPNLNGISRDHMISITDGFILNLDPYLISHPANCQLINHIDNQKKGRGSSITVEELIEKVKNW
jgi:hypothetical protein